MHQTSTSSDPEFISFSSRRNASSKLLLGPAARAYEAHVSGPRIGYFAVPPVCPTRGAVNWSQAILRVPFPFPNFRSSQAPAIPITEQHMAENTYMEPLEAARMAFEDGVKAFQEMTNDPTKKMLAGDFLGSYTMRDVLDSVKKAKAHYQHHRGQSRIREYLCAFSHRVMHYGSVLDVLVQHHPEYTSLAWGTMKILFGAVIEHELAGTTIVAALCDISESLSTAESAIRLYPYQEMVESVSILYAHIMRFLIRALGFYRESPFMHAFHSVTRPTALRYDDLIKAIRRDAESIRRSVATNSQNEIRIIHEEVQDLRGRLETIMIGQRIDSDVGSRLENKVDALTAMLTEFRQTQAWENAARTKSQLEMHRSLSEMHSSQALLFLQSQCILDHKLVLQAASAERCYHRLGPKSSAMILWNSTKLREWAKSESSCTILLKSTHRERVQIRGFCVELVEEILKPPRTFKQSTLEKLNPLPKIVLWVLHHRGKTCSLIETLKSLVYQAICFKFAGGGVSPNEISLYVTKFREAYFKEDYLRILGSLLQDFKRVYIVANAEAFAPGIAAQCRDSLRLLSSMLSDRSSRTVLKVITTAYGPLQRSKTVETAHDLVLDVGKGRERKIIKQGLGRRRAKSLK